MAFNPIRVKFKPSAKDVQVCEESGVDLAQAVHKAVRAQEKQAGTSQAKTGGFWNRHGTDVDLSTTISRLCIEVVSRLRAGLVSQTVIDQDARAQAQKAGRIEAATQVACIRQVSSLLHRQEQLLFGQVKGPGHVGKPRKIWNDVVLSDIHHLSISRPYQVAQSKSAWRAQTCSTRT